MRDNQESRTREPSVFRASSANFPILVENSRNTIGSSFSILSHTFSVPPVNNLKVEVFSTLSFLKILNFCNQIVKVL